MFDFCNSVGGGGFPVLVVVLELLPETMFSTTPDKSVRSGMCEESLLYIELELAVVSLFGFCLLDSTYFSCCFRKMAFFSSSWMLLKELRVSWKDLMALQGGKG